MPALLFVLYVVAEIAALVWTASAIGAVWTVLLLIAGSAVGLFMVRSQGRRVIDGLRRAARGDGTPGAAIADGALVAIGAVLMFVPGLVTSVLGLLVLIPPTRFVLRPVVVFLAARRFGVLAGAAGAAGVVIDGEVVEGDVVGQWYDPDPYARTQPAISPPAIDPDTRWESGKQ